MLVALPDSVQDTLRLSPQQRLAWLRSEAGVGADWTVADLFVTADVAPDALLAALIAVAMDEEILRTSFRAPAGVRVPYQVISASPAIHRLPNGSGEAALRLAAAEAMAMLGADGAMAGTIVAGACRVENGIRLLLGFPAIAVDGAGALRVAARCVRAARGERPEEPVQYADVSEWLLDLRETAHGEAMEQLLAQHGAMTGADAVLVPFAHDPVEPHRYAKVAITLPVATSRAVVAQASAWGIGIDAWWIAAHAALLHRYSGAEAPVTGLLLDGRNQPELEAVIGRLSRVVPIAVSIASDTSLRGLATETASVINGLSDRLDHWPPATAPTTIVHQVAVHASDRWPNCLATRDATVLDPAEPFVTRVTIGPDWLRLDYDAARMEADAAMLLLRQMADIAEHALACEAAPIALLTPKVAVAGRAVTTRGGDVVANRVAQTANADPTALAIRCGEETVDYRALDEQATAFAQGLVAHGVVPGDRVVLTLGKGAGHIAAYLGIWRAGAACVPVDKRGPSERLAAIIADAAPTLIIADEWTVAGDCPVARPDDLLAAASAMAVPSIIPSAPAYLIYTSGTTGVPKGVMVSHAALAAYIDAVTGRLGLSPDAEMGSLAGPDVDLGYTAVFVALGTGRTLRLLPDEAASDADLLSADLERWPLDCLKIVPQHFAGLLAGVDPARAHVMVPRQCLVFGGDQLDAGIVADVRRLRPECRVINHYGPSETTIGVLTASVHDRPGPLPIGYPLDGIDAVVGDARGRPIADGFVGQLWIAGPMVALGYRDRPDLTADRFRPARLGALPGARAYRTGDRVRRLADGSIAFLGRVDHQVKLRGVRIELGDIEAALRSLPSVEDAVVAVIDGSLVAFVRCASDVPLDRHAIQRALCDRLPPTMIPQQIVAVTTFDRTASGKIDRRRLVDLAKPEPQSGGVAPRTQAEAVLVDVIARLIGVPGFGIHDNYFALGGDSIISIQVAAQARRRGVEISANMLFHHQTVAELAAAATAPTAIDAEQGALTGPVPLLPIQRRFFARNHPDMHHYNQSIALASAKLDEAAFVRAIDAVLKHHDILRARFSEHVDGWHQEIASRVDPALSFVRQDLGAAATVDRGAAMQRAATALQASLDLTTGPVFKAGWFDDGNKGSLVIVAHHLVIDAVSWHVLLDDLFSAYAAHIDGDAWAPPAKTTSFRAFAAHVIDAAMEGEFAYELPFWRTQVGVESAPSPESGLDGGPDTVAAARTLSFNLSAEDTNALLTRARAPIGGSMQELLTGAIGAAVAGWTGHASVTIEMESQGREPLSPTIDPSRTVGWFTARYPVRLIPTTYDVAGFARAAKSVLRQVPRRGIGYGLLSRHGTGEIEAPIPFVSFNYLGQLSSGDDADARWRPMPDGAGAERATRGHRDHLIAFNVQIVDGVLHIRLTYAAGYIATATAGKIGEAVLDGLRCLSTADAERLRTTSDFPLAHFDTDAALDQWLAARDIDDAVDVYPLSELQRGMAVQALLAPRAGTYLLQLVTKIVGALDVVRLKAAWARVIDRHAVLRSSIHDLDGERPRQVVHAHVHADWAQFDWVKVPEADIDDRLEAWLEQDRSAGFSLTRAPLMRFALISLDQERTAFVWTRHHAIVDGWSSAQILQQVFADYDGNATDQGTPAAGFRDYIGWLSGRDAAAADGFWSEYLRGVTGPTPLSDGASPAALGQGAADNCVLALTAKETGALVHRARQYRVTPATMLRAAWGIVLARNAGVGDAVFGMVVSGRPDALSGVEAIVGPFINTVPARVVVPAADADIGDWLRALHADQGSIDAHVHVPLTNIQRIVGIPGDRAMFETLFIFENYPIDRAAMAASGLAGQVTGAQTVDKTSYPLTLLVGMSDTVYARFSYNPSQIAAAEVEALSATFAAAVAVIVAGDAAALAALPVTGGSIAERSAAAAQAQAAYAVSATFAPDPLVPFIDYWARMLDHPLRVAHLGNGQVLQDLLDERSAFGRADFRLVLLRWSDLGTLATTDPAALAVEIGGALAAASRHRDVTVILCPPSPRTISDVAFCRTADTELRHRVAQDVGVHLLDASAAFADWGVDDPYDAETERLAGMPYTLQGYAALAMAAGRVHDALHRTPYKAIVVDADNTLWGGICGELGAAGVAVGGGWAEFQRFLLSKRADGFLLCLCSRNNLADVEEVFATRAMPLALDSFVSIRVGWADKAQYVTEIAVDLGLGLDSLVFIDDDPANVLAVERDTGVTSLRCPGREDLLGDFAARLWPLDKVRVLEADRARADHYRIEHDRGRAFADGDDPRSIVEALGVAMDFAPLEEADFDRAADLIQRTNQFNLTLRRRSLAVLRSDLDTGLEGTVVRVRDRFGDYGLVGVMLYRRDGQNMLSVDTFLLSCRALARGVEQAMARHLATIGGAHATIVFDAVEGPRNRPALDFFAALPGDGTEQRWVNAATLATFTLRPANAPASVVRESRAAMRGATASGVYAELATVIRRSDQLLALVSASDTRKLRRAPYAAPGTEMEAVVARFFAELFGLDNIGRDDSFFGLGGNSLQAVQLAGRIRRTFDAPVQLRVVFENPTVAALAAEIVSLTGSDTPAEDDEIMEF